MNQTYIQSKNIIYDTLVLNTLRSPRRSRHSPINAFLASSGGYVVLRSNNGPKDSNASEKEKRK